MSDWRDTYRFLRRRGAAALEQLRESDAEVTEHLHRLRQVGLVTVDDGVVSTVPPERAVAALVDREVRRLDRLSAELQALHEVMTAAEAERREHAGAAEQAERLGTPAGAPVVLEPVEYADVVEVVRTLAGSGSGELMWLRPDQWRIQEGRRIDELVQKLVASGRASRAIYPAQVLGEAPQVVRARAELGEHVRLMAAVPMRLAVLGDAAVIHEDWRRHGGRLLLARHESLVGVLRLLFELLWEQAIAVPGLDARVLAGEDARQDLQQLLLDHLVRGARDEQIARALGVSLRTVRRRIAELMDELGAESRFQAGVEAVRRGWV